MIETAKRVVLDYEETDFTNMTAMRLWRDPSQAHGTLQFTSRPIGGTLVPSCSLVLTHTTLKDVYKMLGFLNVVAEAWEKETQG